MLRFLRMRHEVFAQTAFSPRNAGPRPIPLPLYLPWQGLLAYLTV